MRLATIKLHGAEIAGIVTGKGILPVAALNAYKGTGWKEDMMSLIQANHIPGLTKWYNEGGKEELESIPGLVPTEEVVYAPLYRNPKRIFGIGLNYADHAKDIGNAAPTGFPGSFFKMADTLVGYGDDILLPKLKEEWKKLKASEEKAGEDLPKVDLSKVHATDGVVVEGFDNTPIKFAKCCSPLPGDPIVGFITRGFGVSIHKQTCANAVASMKDPSNAPRWVKAYWADSEKDSYKAGLEIIALNRNELLQDVLSALADIRVPIYAMNARQVENNCAVVSLTIGINNTEHLNRVVARLSKVRDVLKVTRS